MRIPIFGHVKRPQADSQNTGRDVYARPFSVANVTVNGAGGFANFRSLSPVSPSSFNVAFITPAALSGTGNELNTNPRQEPLSDPEKNGYGGRSQF